MLDRLLDKLLGKTVSVSMVTLVLVILGCVGIRALPVGLIPDVDIPYVTVQVDAPDMSARELDEVVVRTLRQNLVQTDHLSGLQTESRDGSASIVLSFEQGQDIDFAFIEVNEKIDRSMSSLPDISRPKVFKASATDIPAFFINVTGRGGALQICVEFARVVVEQQRALLGEPRDYHTAVFLVAVAFHQAALAQVLDGARGLFGRDIHVRAQS